MPTILMENRWQGLRWLRRLPICAEHCFDAAQLIEALRGLRRDPGARWGLGIVDREVGIELILGVPAPSGGGQGLTPVEGAR